jgi:hypothetical protein
MYIVCFDHIFSENAILLSKRLNVEIVQQMNPQNNDIIIVFGACKVADVLVQIQGQLNVEYIIVQSSQFYSKDFDNKYYLDLLYNNSIIDWSKENIIRLKKNIPQLQVFSLYYYDFFVQNDLPDFDSRTIDFYFSGEYSKEREIILTDFKLKNSSYNIEIDLSNSITNNMEYNEKLKNVKYVINLPLFKEEVLNTQLINKALYMGCNVVSLPSIDLELNDLYKNYIYIVPRLCDFTLLIEQEPRNNIIKLIENYGIYQIENNIKGLFYAEKKLKEKIKNKTLLNDNSPV